MGCTAQTSDLKIEDKDFALLVSILTQQDGDELCFL